MATALFENGGAIVNLRIVTARASTTLGASVAATLACDLTACDIRPFPDGELRPVVGDVGGEDVFVIESTGPPVHEHLVELMLLLDACRRGGAERVTAVVPYLGYARQDRRDRDGEALGARVIVDALVGAGAQRLIVVDPHTTSVEAMCSVPVEMLTAVPVLAGALAATTPDDAVVVAPDLGAVKLAERYAAVLGRPVVIVRKHRLSGDTVRAEELVGDVDGRTGVIVDDMISTGGTIEAAARILRAHGAEAGMVATSHGLLVGGATQRLTAAGIARVLVTDTVTSGEGAGSVVEVHSIAHVVAEAIGRLHSR